MWGWVTKVGAWAWAHKQEVVTAWKLYRKLRERRSRNQRNGETAIDYYRRTGLEYAAKTAGFQMAVGEEARVGVLAAAEDLK